MKIAVTGKGGVGKTFIAGSIAAHSVLKALLRHLVVDREDIVILDMDAGIEYLGRGTAEHVDVMLTVTDANRRSLDVARTICRMAVDSAIPRVGLVGNRVTGTAQEEAILDFGRKNGISVLAMLPFDQDVADNGITSAPLVEGHSAALQIIAHLADTLAADTRISSG
jgi:CO dehydrogenase maturation factor